MRCGWTGCSAPVSLPLPRGERTAGFKTLLWLPGRAAFFQAPGSTNDHDLGTFQIGSEAGPSEAGRATVGLYHLAWEVDTLGELKRIAGLLQARGRWRGRRTTRRPRPSTPTTPTGSSSR